MFHIIRDIDNSILHEIALKLESRFSVDMKLQLILHFLVMFSWRPRAYVKLVEGVIIRIFAHFAPETILHPLQTNYWEDYLIHEEFQPSEVVTCSHQETYLLIFGHYLT